MPVLVVVMILNGVYLIKKRTVKQKHKLDVTFPLTHYMKMSRKTVCKVKEAFVGAEGEDLLMKTSKGTKTKSNKIFHNVSLVSSC